jgi:hypothetical protein
MSATGQWQQHPERRQVIGAARRCRLGQSGVQRLQGKIMGDKTDFSRASSERKNLEIHQVVIEMGMGFRAPAGLQVAVRIIVAAPER